jgi:hypothetical protein
MNLLGASPFQTGQFTILSIGFDTTLGRPRHKGLKRAGYTIIEANDVAAVFSYLASMRLDLLLIIRKAPAVEASVPPLENC